MKARAPGKMVLSGAYAVLHGAPAIVSAVDRYVTADTASAAEWVTAEVKQALGGSPAPAFDASPLRDERGKLGLGSSAAILVASLAALELAREATLNDEVLRERVYHPAVTSHLGAQPGGSGSDVTAAVFGRSHIIRKRGDAIERTPVALPSELHVAVYASGRPASTPTMLAAVRTLAREHPARHERWMGAQATAAEVAAQAVLDEDAGRLIDALRAQGRALAGLGDAAGVAIFEADLQEAGEMARRAGAVVLPSGAGGGDIAYYLGPRGVPADLDERFARAGFRRLALGLNARGLHRVD